jgi:hypothetical protein
MAHLMFAPNNVLPNEEAARRERRQGRMDSSVSPQAQTSVTPAVGEGWQDSYGEHPVNEFLSQKPGPQTPFGDDVVFPLPLEHLFYHHPGPESRPNR